MGNARTALFERLIDHAPLFPPASLPLREAVAEDERARESPHSFALGRFVCPASALSSLPDVGRGVTVVLDGSIEPEARVEAVEAPPGTDLESLGGLAPETYVEVRLDGDLEHEVTAVVAHGFLAKGRCSDGASALGDFLRECRRRELPFKLTAGLHHAVRTEREHGLLNVLAAAVFGDEGALEEDDPKAFALSSAGFRWRGRVADAEAAALARRVRLRSIGSCSFFEPVEELEALGILAR